MNVHYTCMIVIMIMQRIMTCYMHINLSFLTFVVMWNLTILKGIGITQKKKKKKKELELNEKELQGIGID